MNQTIDPSSELTTRVSKRWSIKMLVIGLVVFGFGIWGLVDATYVYPNRGKQAAEWLEWQYLDVLSRDGALINAGVTDPKATLDSLSQSLAAKGSLGTTDRALFDWLEQLSFAGVLDGPTATAIPRTDFRGDQVDAARTRLETLAPRWTSASGAAKKSPNRLSRWDIPVQWLITVGGVVAGLWIFLLIARVRAIKFKWNPVTQQLTLPGGGTVTPSDIDNLDKRKWHKFYVTMHIKQGHATMGGKAVELDLLRHEPLEDWVLAMEKTAFPEAQKEDGEPAQPVAADANSVPQEAAGNPSQPAN